MGVVDTLHETAGNVAGAGAALLIEAGHAAGTVLKAGWTAPPMRIPADLVGGKKDTVIEIPPAILMMGAGLLLAYGWLRMKGVKPFDWLWTEIEKAKAEGEAGGSGGPSIVKEANAAGRIAWLEAAIERATAVIAEIDAALATGSMTAENEAKLQKYRADYVAAVEKWQAELAKYK